MASNKLSALSAVSGSLTSDSLVYIADTQDSGSSYSSKKITVANLLSDVATTTDLGTFTGTTIDNNQSIKAAIQALETAVETKQATDAELTELATMASTTAAALADLTEAEVQILDGATVTTAELNILDLSLIHISEPTRPY